MGGSSADHPTHSTYLLQHAAENTSLREIIHDGFLYPKDSKCAWRLCLAWLSFVWKEGALVKPRWCCPVRRPAHPSNHPPRITVSPTRCRRVVFGGTRSRQVVHRLALFDVAGHLSHVISQSDVIK